VNDQSRRHRSTLCGSARTVLKTTIFSARPYSRRAFGVEIKRTYLLIYVNIRPYTVHVKYGTQQSGRHGFLYDKRRIAHANNTYIIKYNKYARKTHLPFVVRQYEIETIHYRLQSYIIYTWCVLLITIDERRSLLAGKHVGVFRSRFLAYCTRIYFSFYVVCTRCRI